MRLPKLFAIFAAVLAFALPAPGAPLFEELSVFAYGPSVPSSGALVLAPDGYYWGTSTKGGTVDYGVIYKVKPDGSDLRVVHTFPITDANVNDGHSPAGGLTYDDAGYMWGTTTSGYDDDITESAFEGTIFKIKVSDGTFKTLVRFSVNGSKNKGQSPSGRLIRSGAYMWGTTRYGGASGDGTIFRVLMSTGALTTVAQFTGTTGATKGSNPRGGLVFDDGLFWGMTSLGGAAGYGTIFTVSPTGAFSTVLEFTGLAGANKGEFPDGELVSDGDFFWGTTERGGAANLGTVFKLEKATKILTTKVEFTGNGAMNKGANPRASLVSDGAGALWGVTERGGTSDEGTVFKIETATAVLTTKTHFTGSLPAQTGARPSATLSNDGAGNFIGTLSAGGGDLKGRIFRIRQSDGAVTTLADFLSERRRPNSALQADATGKLWGVTLDRQDGEAFLSGAIYKFDPATGLRTTVHVFFDLLEPAGQLYFDGANTFWGMANRAGTSDCGGIFKVNTTTGVVTTVLSFTGEGGVNPGDGARVGLVSGGGGILWGSTPFGGATDHGTIFKLNTATNAFTKVVEFTGEDGAAPGEQPSCPLVDDGAGFMWGTTRFGGAGSGTIFKINKTTGAFSSVQTFAPDSSVLGRFPNLGVKVGGTIWGGGVAAVIKIDIATSVVTVIQAKRTDGFFVPDGAGFLWDTAEFGGVKVKGGITKTDLTTGIVTNVFSFFGNNAPFRSGQAPIGPLYRASNGDFYGVTRDGGTDGGGTLFRVAQQGGVDLSYQSVVILGTRVLGQPGFTAYGPLGAPQPGAFGGTFFSSAPKAATVFAPDGTIRVKVGDQVASINNVAIKTLAEPTGDAVTATLQPVAPVSLKDDEVLLGGLTNGPWKVIARENQVITGQPGDVRLKKIMAYDGHGPDYFFLAQLQGTGVAANSDMALCVAPGDGTVRAVVREKDVLNGKTVTIIASLVAVAKSNADERWRATASSFGVRLTFSDGTQAYFTVPSSTATPADWVQGLTTNAPFGTAKVSTLGFPGFGELGPAGVVTLKAGTQPVDPKRNVLVVRTAGVNATVLATKGEPAPDPSGVAIPNAKFGTFSEPVSGKGGRTAFMATLAGVPSPAGIWYAADGTNLKQLARAGAPAPGGGVWATFTQLALPGGATSGPLFMGTLKADRLAGISAANNTGLWSVRSDGSLELTVRTGQDIIIDEVGRKLKSFIALKTSTDSLGSARGYDDAGHVAILATFVDKSVVLLRFRIP